MSPSWRSKRFIVVAMRNYGNFSRQRSFQPPTVWPPRNALISRGRLEKYHRFSRQSVLVAQSMAKAAQFTVSGGLGIVHSVFHWLEST